MNPDVEFFLERVFNPARPAPETVGRVVVEPDYEACPNADDQPVLRSELNALLAEQKVRSSEVASPEGMEVVIPARFSSLAKYLRRIVLHRDRVEGPFVEVAPPGGSASSPRASVV